MKLITGVCFVVFAVSEVSVPAAVVRSAVFAVSEVFVPAAVAGSLGAANRFSDAEVGSGLENAVRHYAGPNVRGPYWGWGCDAPPVLSYGKKATPVPRAAPCGGNADLAEDAHAAASACKN